MPTTSPHAPADDLAAKLHQDALSLRHGGPADRAIAAVIEAALATGAKVRGDGQDEG